MNNINYLGNPNLKKSNVPVDFTQEQVLEYIKCGKDPIYFIKTYMQIVTVDDGLIPFKYSGNYQSKSSIDVRDAVILCQKAYYNFSVFRNTIDIMTEFSVNNILYLLCGYIISLCCSCYLQFFGDINKYRKATYCIERIFKQ